MPVSRPTTSEISFVDIHAMDVVLVSIDRKDFRLHKTQPDDVRGICYLRVRAHVRGWPDRGRDRADHRRQ